MAQWWMWENWAEKQSRKDLDPEKALIQYLNHTLRGKKSSYHPAQGREGGKQTRNLIFIKGKKTPIVQQMMMESS